MSRWSAFVLGVREYRLMVTSNVPEADSYDWGREWAHRVTFRRFEEA